MKKPEKSLILLGFFAAMVFTVALNSSSVLGTSTPAAL